MAEPSLPDFAEPGSYVRYYGASIVDPRDSTPKFRYLRLGERDAPLSYPYTFASIAVDGLSGETIFDELEPGQTHIYQAFLGVSPGIRVRVSHPQDIRLLKWDQKISDISDDLTGVINHGISPYEKPTYELWIPPKKQYPSLKIQNATGELVPGGKSIKPRIIWLASVFRYEIIDESQPEILDMLMKKKIPSRPVRLGGAMREIPR